MQLLKASEYKASRETDGIYITICGTGVIALNCNVIKLLSVQPEDRIVITKDSDNTYYIGKSKSKTDTDAYLLREYNKTKSLQFNARGIVKEMIRELDLAIAPERKKSVRLNILVDQSETWEGMKLYQIES